MTTTAEYTVNGMSCGHCVAAVTEELTAIAGVTGVDVDLESGRVQVSSDAPIAPADIAAAVVEAGYEVAS